MRPKCKQSTSKVRVLTAVGETEGDVDGADDGVLVGADVGVDDGW